MAVGHGDIRAPEAHFLPGVAGHHRAADGQTSPAVGRRKAASTHGQQVCRGVPIIKKVGDDYKIEIRQKKTRDRLSNPLSPEILHWLPERSDEASSSDIVFPLVAEQYVNDKIREIAKEAGIHKHLSFHMRRHTCATMMLTLGVDLYTVSKLLGHRRVTTTQIYGNIVGFAFLSHDSGKSE